MKKIIVIVSLLAGCIFAQSAGAQEKWESLFDGKTLTGWTQKGGKAPFTVEDGMIVGTTVPDEPNSFLCTEKSYGNFILEFEFLVDEGLNSGVQFRSQFTRGLVRGYQYEIDPDMTNMYQALPANLDAKGKEIHAGKEPRMWTGGIYDEKGRGWIGALTGNPAARAAFKPGQWNKGRVEAVNDVIKTYINGVPAAHVVDYAMPNGFIALQVHAVPKFKEMKVCFRNLRIQDLGAAEEPGDKPDPFISEWRDASTGNIAQIYFDTKAGAYKVNVTDQPYKNVNPLFTLEAEEKADELYFANTDGYKGAIENKRLIITGPNGFKFTGQKFTRKSPTLGQEAPANAIVLFDGTDMSKWGSLAPKEWVTYSGEASESVKMVPGGRFEMIPGKGSIISKQDFGDCFLHVEFRLLGEQTNGGVYMMSRYEFNIKDSYGQGYGSTNGELGNISEPDYGHTETNHAMPPMVWQTMDIDFRAPRYDKDGNKTEHARATMRLNGELIYEDIELISMKGAAGRLPDAATGPVYLQEHGTAYQFRNIWIIDKSAKKGGNKSGDGKKGSGGKDKSTTEKSGKTQAKEEKNSAGKESTERKPANKGKK